MDFKEQKKAAEAFARAWAGEYKEDGNTAPFWMSLLRDVYGAAHPEQMIFFEETVKHEEKGNSLFIDARIPSRRIIIEQKATGEDLGKKYPRHGKLLTPYEQAFEYDQTQPVDQRARCIIACNFHEFWIYDMNVPEKDRVPLKLALADLPRHLESLAFLVDGAKKPEIRDEVQVSVDAGRLVGKLYDAFLSIYKSFGNGTLTAKDYHDINVLCVRLVFCLYAEDSGLFGTPDAFSRYLESWRVENTQEALQKLFLVLDTPIPQRSRFLDKRLAAFPYVNGGLFHDESVEVPPLTEEICHILVDDMSRGFDWSAISPTIFGAVFESTLNPETRRKGGMHYTSIENIHKVIDPLFLDDLKAELHAITDIPEREKINQGIKKELVLKYGYREKLEKFQDKLASLTFLDPACGSGNFLTETYLCLRRLENKLISELNAGQQVLDTESETVKSPIKVSIRQFYGIEINDFAVTVAKTALWIAESQMMKETESIIRKDLDFLPLKTNASIHEGNALRMDWKSVIPPEKLSYCMGNPPFVGHSYQSQEQKNDILSIYVNEKGKPYKMDGKIDYVAGWYFKAAQYMTGTNIHAAFVSTNSITQGEQVAAVWKPLYDRFHVHIDFAWRTFVWDNEASSKAHVHVVIIGFSVGEENNSKRIYDKDGVKTAANISPYLTDSPTIFIESRTKPICDVPEMRRGNQPTDGGNLIFTKAEMEAFVQREPQAKRYFKKFSMGADYLKGNFRYCLWLVGVSPKEINAMPIVKKQVEKVREFRLKSTFAPTREMANTPSLFREQINPLRFLALPKVSSERRQYIPIGYLDSSVVPGDKIQIVEDATLYHFGVLTSSVHMAWMRAVAGRLKSDYSYSIRIVYNNFPWPNPSSEQYEKIEKTAQAILDARALYPDSSLVDLYDPALMPPQLRKAHAANDRAVMAAYGFDADMPEEDIVAELMKRYEKLVEEKGA